MKVAPLVIFFQAKRNLILIISIGLILLLSNNRFALAQTTTCSSIEINGLCYGIRNNAQCSTSIITDCSAYPRCTYSGTTGTYYCNNHCYNTGQSGSCGTGRVCLCVDRVACPLCSSNSSACSESGCGGSDVTPPTITITSPTSNSTYTTSVSPFNLAGTASDNVVISQIKWSNNRNTGFVGGSGTASGTASWSADYINLESGQNVITVTASDGSGNQSTDNLTVTYNPPSSANYPLISLTEGASSYSINISDPDALTEVAYAWGARPNVYFIVPFASDSNPVLSTAEQARYNNIISNFPVNWDKLTLNKHPMNFYFVEPYAVSTYSSSQNDWFKYVSDSISQLKSDHSGIMNYPAVYVFLYPEPYFSETFTNKFGSEDKQELAEIYFSYFNDQNAKSNEIISNILLHELAHDFSDLPNDVNFPPGNTKRFWLSHPAGFLGASSACDENTSLFDCSPYGASESPTGTEGYYEAYSILSLQRSNYTKSQMGNRDPELSPLVEMALGIRSKYEDAPYMYYEGYFNTSGFNLIAPHDYNISSRWTHDYSSVERAPGLYWDIRFESPKTTLTNTTRSFTVQKSDQLNRSLLVYANDAQNPGYFKVFGTNARSTTVSSPVILGDLNADGSVNIFDIQLTANVAVGTQTDPAIVSRADVNGDGSVNIFDIQTVANLAAGG